jgi:hypothetical protein
MGAATSRFVKRCRPCLLEERIVMNAEQYLNEALSGNMNLSALKPYISAGLLACHEIMEGYARHKLAEAHPQADNSHWLQSAGLSLM